MVELMNEDREYLTMLLQKRHNELLHEMHHAVSRDFKAGLRQELELTERLQGKVGLVPVAVG